MRASFSSRPRDTRKRGIVPLYTWYPPQSTDQGEGKAPFCGSYPRISSQPPPLLLVGLGGITMVTRRRTQRSQPGGNPRPTTMCIQAPKSLKHYLSWGHVIKTCRGSRGYQTVGTNRIKSSRPGYLLRAHRRGRRDCPYYVGTYHFQTRHLSLLTQYMFIIDHCIAYFITHTCLAPFHGPAKDQSVIHPVA